MADPAGVRAAVGFMMATLLSTESERVIGCPAGVKAV